MRKRRLVFFLLVMISVLALVTACGSGGGGGDDSGGNFKGSCTEVDLVDWIVCVDYYEGYSVQDAKDLCAATNDSYSSEKCASVNTSLTKVPGKCEVLDQAFNNRRSQTSYYGPNWNEPQAQGHCSAYPAGYTATWISD